MSDLRIYAETGACLLNTGPDVDHETDAVRRSMKEEVLLYYDPSRSFLRCYVQVQRAQPEQFAFEYEHDGGPDTDIFGAFVSDARREVEKTNWRIIDENSAVFTALESGPYTEPKTDEDDVRALLSEDERIEFAATDRTTAVGLVPYLRETFGEEHSIAISRAGRVRPVADADFVVVPDRSYTGLTDSTKERLERVQVEYWQGELSATVTELSDGTGRATRTDRLIGHIRREGLDDRFGIVARPASASWSDPGERWFVATAVAGTVLAAASLLATTVSDEVLGLLGREVTFTPPLVSLPSAVPDVLSGGVGFPSWVVVAVTGVLLAVGGGSFCSVVGVRTLAGRFSLSFPSSGGRREPPSVTDPTLTAPEKSVGECLDRLVDAAGRETAVESLSAELDGRGVDVLSEREASLYSVGARALGVVAGVAVSAAVYLGGGFLVRRLVSLLSGAWVLVLNGLVGIALVVVVAGVGAAVSAALGRDRTTDRSTGTVGTAGTGTGKESRRSRTDRPAGATGSGDESRRSRRGGQSEVSPQRVEELQRMMNNPERLKQRIEPQSLLEELQKNPQRDDIKELLRRYEHVTSETVVSSERRGLIEPSSGFPSSGDRPGSSADRPDDDGDGTDDPSGESRGGPAHGDDSDRSPGSTGDTPAERSPTPEDPGVGCDTDTPEGGGIGNAPADDGSQGTTADASVTGPSNGFAEFRYDGANSGYVRCRHGSGARPTSGWEYRTDNEPLAPVVSGGTVYIVDRGGRIYAVDETGEERWTAAVDDEINSSPALRDDKLYFGSESGTLYAMDTSGDRLWAERIGASSGRLSGGTAEIITPPAVTGGTVYVGDTEGEIHARDAATGREAWRDKTDGAIYGKLAIDGERLFAANENGLLAAYDTGGEQIWSAGAEHGITTAPAIDDGSWYVVDRNGVIHRYDPTQSGAEVGTHPIGRTAPVSPTVGDGRVFVGTETGTVIAVGADLERRWWNAETDHGDRILAPFLLDERNLYVPAGRRVYAFDPLTGRQSWSFRLKNEVRAQPVYGDGSLFVATTAGCVRALHLD
jgi:outer membrane protein assembly factor BamB